jgi:hypothetical protein
MYGNIVLLLPPDWVILSPRGGEGRVKMQAVTLWITVIAIVLVVAYLVAPQSQAPKVLQALGSASASNIRALAGGAG